MSHEPVENALALFRECCELPPHERAAFLDVACGHDAELRRQVESMLAWDDAEDPGKDDAVPHPVRAVLSNLADRAQSLPSESVPLPAEIGGYRIVRLIAHGGMGVVYEAQQESPKRRVAIKVARTGGTGSERGRRFELEAQLLARLHHPGIAQIIEAGTTGTEVGAVPYFVMEYVEGQTLTDYADQHLRAARARLELMVSVCAAVAFAHAQGVTHRDLKPDNVLVEANGAPRVLDFGVAKVEAAAGFGAATLRTEAGRILGTMGYMAPEQLAGTTDGVGPTADVYSLGVMLYELLTGRLPHELSGATITQALAVIATTDAPPLSVVRPEYRGDIEALVAKALEKDPRHRYADAAALQHDLERHLRGEPILARPAGPLRRLVKWTRRNRALATAVCGVFLALATAAAVLLVKNQEVQAALLDNRRLLDSRQLRLARLDADELWPARAERAGAMQHWLDETHQQLQRTVEHRAALQRLRDRAGVQLQQTWTFADPDLQRRHAELEQLVQGLEALALDTKLFADVRARLDLALSIADMTVDQRRADWDAAIARIQRNPKYAGLALEPQVGLVPLGEDPDSHLEEFLHLQTHVGPIPAAGNGAGSTLGFVDNVPPPQTGLVFVLIPRGSYWMGVQAKDPDARNYDTQLTGPEKAAATPVHWVDVEPFLLAKYEMTNGQWERFVGSTPSASKGPGKPVTNVSWTKGTEILGRLDLVLPSEEQWEYAARAGVAENPPAWWTGPDLASLEGKENVLEQVAKAANPDWTKTSQEQPAPWEDRKRRERIEAGSPGPAPVGSYEANGFGLFDMGGNVTEWCTNELVLGTSHRFCRGGNHRRGPIWARSTARIPCPVAVEMEELGLRPVMKIRWQRPR